jgi:D-threo-aldose 1-dehydrogenase
MYDYAPASPEVLQRARAIGAVCARHNVPLRAAALQFPLSHPTITTVIPGARDVAEAEENLALMTQAIPDSLWEELRHEGLIR